MGYPNATVMAEGAHPPSKKRKLPVSFHGIVAPSKESRIQAAMRIQRFLRWRRELAAHLDPISQERILPREAVVLLEAGGVQHWFSAGSLASYFISTARFCNPLSRRPLRCWEVNQILFKQPAKMRPLLAATFVARFALQKDAHENAGTDLASSMEDTLDMTLEAMLSKAEKTIFEFRIERLLVELEDYEETLYDLCCISARRADSLSQRHREIAKNRGFFCPQMLASELAAIHEKIVVDQNVRDGEVQVPMPILKEALLRRLRFN